MVVMVNRDWERGVGVKVKYGDRKKEREQGEILFNFSPYITYLTYSSLLPQGVREEYSKLLNYVIALGK